MIAGLGTAQPTIPRKESSWLSWDGVVIHLSVDWLQKRI